MQRPSNASELETLQVSSVNVVAEVRAANVKYTRLTSKRLFWLIRQQIAEGPAACMRMHQSIVPLATPLFPPLHLEMFLPIPHNNTSRLQNSRSPCLLLTHRTSIISDRVLMGI